MTEELKGARKTLENSLKELENSLNEVEALKRKIERLEEENKRFVSIEKKRRTQPGHDVVFNSCTATFVSIARS